MKLPAIEIPDESSDKARQWAYRLAVLPFESTVADVALLVAAAMAEAVEALGTCGTCAHHNVESPGDAWGFCAPPTVNRAKFPFRHRLTPLDERCKGYTRKEAA